ncbi:MAG TPA: type I-MYXAN CRISPR-associated protein Cas6/Cmx6 [Isosphaeraceae bacterium]|jgi:CRISPR-associated protein Cas6
MIDLSFELEGDRIPLDYGYALFSALSRVVPRLHGDLRVGVHPIRGVRREPRVLTLVPASRLRLRLPPEDLVSYIGLAGAHLDLEGFSLRIGIPRVESLVPSASLTSRIVTIKGAQELDTFGAAVRRQLAEAKISAEPVLEGEAAAGGPARRVFRIKDRRLIGFSLRVVGLTAEESLRLQECGLGGRRRMGCGVFIPVVQRS